MEYDFKTYLNNALNETEDKTKSKDIDFDRDVDNLTNDDANKRTNFNDIIKNIKFVDGEWKYFDESISKNDVIEFIEGNRDAYKKFKSKNKNNPIIRQIDKIVNKKDTTRRSTDRISSTDWNTNTFENFGKAVAYRSALGVVSNEENVQQLVRDIMEDESEYSIKQLANLSDIILYAAAVQTVKNIQKREEKRPDVVEKCNDTLKELFEEDTRNSTIKLIQKDYKTDFDKYQNQFKAAFEDGMKKQKKEMSESNYKWEDPITHVPPKGFTGKANQIFKVGVKGIENINKKLKDKIPREHNLQNDLARLALMGVSAMLLAGKGIGKLFSLFKDTKWSGTTFGYIKETSKQKVDDAINEMNKYNGEYNKWKKTLDDTKKQNMINELIRILNDEVLPCYYNKMLYITASFDNIEDNYIIKKTDEGWSTKNSPNNNYEFIEYNAILMLKLLNNMKSKLKDSMELFKDSGVAFNQIAIPNFNMSYYNNFIDWCNSLNKDYGFKKILFAYNKDVLKNPNTFHTIGDVLDYANKTIPELQKVTKISIIKNEELDFKNTVNVTVPGIIIQKEEDEQVEAEEMENLSAKLKNIEKDILSLKDINNSDKLNEIDKITTKLLDVDSEVQKAYELLWNTVTDKDNYIEFKIDKEKTPIAQKIVKVKGLMDKLGITESVVLNKINLLLTEDTNNLEPLQNELKNLITKKYEDGDLKKYEEIKDKIEKTVEDEKIKKNPDYIFALNLQDKEKTIIVKDIEELIKDVEDDVINFNTDSDKNVDETIGKIKAWCGKDENKLNVFNGIDLGEFKDDIIPKIWKCKYFIANIDKKESYNPFYINDFMIMLESNESDVIEGIKTVFSAKNVEDFKSKYGTWKKNLIEKFKNSQNYKEDITEPIKIIQILNKAQSTQKS